MPISLNDLYKVLNKEASQKPQPDPGQQAMLLAAQAAKPAGAPALPKAIEQPQPEDVEDQGPDLEKLVQEKDKELEKKKKEAEDLRHQLQQEQLQHQQAVLLQEVEKKEKESIQRIKKEQEQLQQQKTIQEAEHIQHKAQLDKETAMAQVKLEQQKSKTLIDLSKQQAQQEIQHIDRTRKNVDKYMQESVKKLDKQKQEFEASKSAISPALQSVMDNALSALHSIPTPGGMPITIKKASIFGDVVDGIYDYGNGVVTDVYNSGKELVNKGKQWYEGKRREVAYAKIAQITGPHIAQIIVNDAASLNNLIHTYNTNPQTLQDPKAVFSLLSDNVKTQITAGVMSGYFHNVGDQATNTFLQRMGMDAKQLQQQGINVTEDPTPDKISTTDAALTTAGDFFAPQYTAQELNNKVSELVTRKINGVDVNLSDYTDSITLGVVGSTDPILSGKTNPYLSDSDQQFIVANWGKLSDENKRAAGALLSPQFRQAVPGGWRFGAEGDTTYNDRLEASKQTLNDHKAYKEGIRTSVSDSAGNMKRPPASVYSTSPFDQATGGLYSTVAPYIPMVGNMLGVPLNAPGFRTPSRLKPSKFKPLDAQGIAHEGNITYKDSRLQHIGNNRQLSSTIPGGSMLLQQTGQ